MKIKIINKSIDNIQSDILFIPIVTGDAQILNYLDKKFGPVLRNELIRTQFCADFGEAMEISSKKNKAAKTILFGLGEPQALSAETLRRFAGNALEISKKNKIQKIAFVLYGNLDRPGNIQAIAEALWLADYKFNKYKLEPDSRKITPVDSVFVKTDVTMTRAESAIKQAAISVLGTVFARDLVNEPSNIVTPRYLAAQAQEISASSKRIEAGILGREELEKNNFGALLAVAQGSNEEPFLIHLKYSHPRPKKRIAIIGKGVTFDSGGLSLKPSDKITDMKIDMAGAAAVLGLFRSLSILDLPLEIHGVIPTCENMIGSQAIKPGDIIKSYSGKTIEIVNTDAEGRLILADAISYTAKNYLPNIIVDIATLTGACIISLGENIAGLMTRSDALAQDIICASKERGELVWRLPLPEDYKEKMKSDIADIQNIHEGKAAGAIMGGLFLQEFVSENIEFAHIDIAGPAWEKKGKIKYLPKGATGFGVRLLLGWLQQIAKGLKTS